MYGIKRSSWHYRYLYDGEHWWRPGISPSKEPTNADFCSHWRKIILFLLLTPFWIILLVGGSALIVSIWGVGWFFGKWPNIGKYRNQGSDFFHEDYKYDGKNYHRFAPWEIVFPLAAIVGIVYWGTKSLSTMALTAAWSGIITGSIVLIIGIIFLLAKGWESETFKSFREYLKARKMKICPKAKFVD